MRVNIGEPQDDGQQDVDVEIHPWDTWALDYTLALIIIPALEQLRDGTHSYPDEFKELKRIAESKGFLIVASSPLTRSSYHADEDFRKMKQLRDNQSQCHPLQ